MAFDLVIDVENTPGALAKVAAAVSDAGVNIAAATCIGTGQRAEVHILVPHAEAAKHSPGSISIWSTSPPKTASSSGRLTSPLCGPRSGSRVERRLARTRRRL